MQNARIKQILIVLKSYKKNDMTTLIGLFDDKKTVLSDYVVPKLIYTMILEINSSMNA